MKRLLLACVPIALVTCGPASAANRCTDAKGKVTYQDTACSPPVGTTSRLDTSEAFSTRPTAVTPPSDAKATPTNSLAESQGDYATYRGAWRGPMQLELSLNGARDGDAHALAPMVIEVRADGEVVGTASKIGCQFSGLATQNVAAYMASIDVSLKGCSDQRFNTRYSGNLVAIASAKEAKLRLVGLVMRPAAPLTVKMQQVSIDAVLKR